MGSVVPFEVNASKLGASLVSGDMVMLLEGNKEMVVMSTTNIFDAEVIHNKDKNKGAPFVMA